MTLMLQDYLLGVSFAAIFMAVAILIALAVYLFNPVRKEPHHADPPPVLVPVDLDSLRNFRMICRNTCPDCKGFGFYGGPRGGISQHIYCANAKCRAAFNISHFSATEGTVERIEPKSEEWYNNA